MPIPENYASKYWFQNPEPCCKPGYTGYLPDYGARRLFQFGETYGVMTHNIMKKHPVAGLRMGNILNNDPQLKSELETDAMTWIHEINSENIRFRSGMVPGYTGYVPQRMYKFGKSYDKDCKEAIAQVEKTKMLRDSGDLC